eukprot:GHVO01026502.1.p1 GENE.GHVO01026502.1~~GHVO01026502.1.p1  ORF type:complete len:185 (+),score=13.70 GHVO01026502.1:277-831(+)
MDAATFYFARNCTDLTPAEQIDVKKAFKDVLAQNKICQLRGTQLCDLHNFGIICGKESVRRRKRSVDGQEYDEHVSEVKLQFEVKANKSLDSSKETKRICALLRIPQRSCSVWVAKQAYKRYLRAAVIYSGRQLQALYKNPERASFSVAQRDFEAKKEGVAVGSTDSLCDPGMAAHNGMCGECL